MKRRRGAARRVPAPDRSERGWGSHWRADGRPKTAYTQSLAAEKVREMELADLDDGMASASPSAYQCDHCGRWHVGNLRRRSPD